MVVGPTTLQPGDRRVIRVSLDARGQAPDLRKAIEIRTDEPGRPTTTAWVAARLPSEDETPRQLSRAIFRGKCAACHAAPAAGKTGKALYDAACAMCHEPQPNGLLDAKQLREWGSDWEAVSRAIRHGMPHTTMPAFARSEGGSLSEAQIASLRALLPGGSHAPAAN